ncbi:hypothetical protein K504DRAFT_449320 [Pleomassaria siparia CBS 279.74]|uniref:DUF7136 domain-containing protein n=1 Tax=Pleomassaria siparia CBS 279.74 TaxID=1314801 RepID=A0A6G1JX23_9PLEO|nr:hypothetical protein K504DRAFT_449320 [Pleomassaria siparia CBS 279.74]
MTDKHIIFTTQTLAQEVDLVTATKDKNCPFDVGIAISVTDTLNVSSSVDWSDGDMCAVVALSNPTPDPCRVSVDSAAASSISASVKATACKSTSLPASTSCPAADKGKSAAQRLVVGFGSVVCLGSRSRSNRTPCFDVETVYVRNLRRGTK